MAELDCAEVPVVDRGDTCDVHPFGHCHDVRVDGTEREALILLDQVNGPVEILRLRGKQLDLALLDRAQEGDLRAGAEMLLQVVTDLDHHRGRHQQRWRASVQRWRRGACRRDRRPRKAGRCPKALPVSGVLGEQQFVGPLGHIRASAGKST